MIRGCLKTKKARQDFGSGTVHGRHSGDPEAAAAVFAGHRLLRRRLFILVRQFDKSELIS